MGFRIQHLAGNAFRDVVHFKFQRSKMVATGEDGNYTEADVKRAMNSYNAPDAVNQVPRTAAKAFVFIASLSHGSSAISRMTEPT